MSRCSAVSEMSPFGFGPLQLHADKFTAFRDPQLLLYPAGLCQQRGTLVSTLVLSGLEEGLCREAPGPAHLASPPTATCGLAWPQGLDNLFLGDGGTAGPAQARGP